MSIMSVTQATRAMSWLAPIAAAARLRRLSQWGLDESKASFWFRLSQTDRPHLGQWEASRLPRRLVSQRRQGFSRALGSDKTWVNPMMGKGTVGNGGRQSHVRGLSHVRR